MTSFRKAVESYLAMRQALGYKLQLPGAALRQFAAFLERQGASHITTALALRWAQESSHVQPAQWANRLSFVRTFARYWSATDPKTEIPPVGILPYRYNRTAPYLYTDEQIQRLLEAAQEIPPATGFSRWTYPTLFGLLAVSGLRVGEIIALQREDVDLRQGLLTIRLTKFRKSRLIPLHPSTCEALKRYVRQRNHRFPRGNPRFFVSDQGTPLIDSMVRWTFVKLSRQIGLRGPLDRFGPRLHDLRHRFAIQTMLDWYRSGVDVEQRLPVLSTWLGHAHVSNTYWYLSATPELLALSAKRLEKQWEGLS